MKTTDGRRQTAKWMMDGRPWTVVGRAFQSAGGRTVNEWGTNQRMETADRGRQTAVAQAFQPVREGKPSTN